jgi:hypothetical protein
MARIWTDGHDQPGERRGVTMADEPAVLVERFNRMVARDGGTLTLLSADATAPDCGDGSCTLPQAELQQLMSETVARQRPGVRVQVEVIP